MKKIIVFILMFFTCLVNVSASELPKVYLTGNDENWRSKKDVRDFSVTYVSDEINFTSYAKLKIQGSSSVLYDKKNYNITLYKDIEHKSKYKVDFGWGEESKYCLKANWIDKTHSRNIVTANIIADINKHYNVFENTPNYGMIDGYPIEVYMNNEFLGLYTLNIPKDAWLYNLDEDIPNNIAIFADYWSDSVYFKEEAVWGKGFEIEAGVEDEETLKKLNRVINFVSKSDNKTFKEQINNYFNLDSLLNYYILCEYAALYDNTGRNMMLVTYDGKIWNTALYDLDTAWGVNSIGKELIDSYELKIEMDNNLLFKRLKENFNKELADRYFELRDNFLTKEKIMERFISFKQSIPTEVFLLENEKWDNIPGYDIEQIEDYLDVRIPYLNQYFTELYSYIPPVEENNNNLFIPGIVMIVIIILGAGIIIKI